MPASPPISVTNAPSADMLDSDSPSESEISSLSSSARSASEDKTQANKKRKLRGSPMVKKERKKSKSSDENNKPVDESKDSVKKEENNNREEECGIDEPEKKFPKAFPFPQYVERISKLLPSSNPFKDNPGGFVNCRNLVAQTLRSSWQDRYRSPPKAKNDENSSFHSSTHDSNSQSPTNTKNSTSGPNNTHNSSKTEKTTRRTSRAKTSRAKRVRATTTTEVPPIVSDPDPNPIVETNSSPEKTVSSALKEDTMNQERLKMNRTSDNSDGDSSDTSDSTDDSDE